MPTQLSLGWYNRLEADLTGQKPGAGTLLSSRTELWQQLNRAAIDWMIGIRLGQRQYDRPLSALTLFDVSLPKTAERRRLVHWIDSAGARLQ